MNTYMFKYSNIHVPRQSMSSGTLGDHTPDAPHTYTVSMALDGDISQSSSQNSVHSSPYSLFQPLQAIAPFTGARIGWHGLAKQAIISARQYLEHTSILDHPYDTTSNTCCFLFLLLYTYCFSGYYLR